MQKALLAFDSICWKLNGYVYVAKDALTEVYNMILLYLGRIDHVINSMLISGAMPLYMSINDHVDGPGVNYVTDKSEREPIRAGAEVMSNADKWCSRW